MTWGITNRRHFMKHAASFGALAASSSSFLSELKANTETLKKNGKSLIVIHFGGGYPAIDFWDPKPGHPNGGETKGKTFAPGVMINELLPKIGAQMKNISTIRSLTTTEGDHMRGTTLMLTGFAPNPLLEYPHVGSKLAYLNRENEGDLPAFITVGGGGGRGPGFLGMRYAPFTVQNPGQPPENIRPPQDVAGDRMVRRSEIFGKLEAGFQTSTKVERDAAKAHQEVYGKALSLVVSKNKDVFSIDKEPMALQTEYGTTQFGKSCLMARKLVEAGASCVEVNTGGWDLHGGIFATLARRLPEIDAGIGTLVKDLAARGKLKDTVIVTLSEFGRTPRINNGGGRDHYPRAWSVMVAGGSIKGGIAYGATDAGGEGVTDKPVKVGDLFATVYKGLGLDLTTQIRDNLGRPAPIAGEKATAIADLVG